MSKYIKIYREDCTLLFPTTTEQSVKIHITQVLQDIALQQIAKGGKENSYETSEMSVPSINQKTS